MKHKRLLIVLLAIILVLFGCCQPRYDTLNQDYGEVDA